MLEMERRFFEEMLRRQREEPGPSDGQDAVRRYEVDVCVRYNEMRKARERRGVEAVTSPRKVRQFDELVERAIPAMEALGMKAEARRNPLHGRIWLVGECLRLNPDAPQEARDAVAELLARADDQAVLPVQGQDGGEVCWELWFDLFEETGEA